MLRCYSLSFASRWTVGNKAELARSAAYPPALGLAMACVHEYIIRGSECEHESTTDFLDRLASLVLLNLPERGEEPWTVPVMK